MSEPTTQAGKALLASFSYDLEGAPFGGTLVDGVLLDDRILAIEREAATAAYPDLARKAAIGEAVEPWVRRMVEMECVLDSYADVRECVVHVSEWPWPNPRCEGAQAIAAALEQGDE